MSDWIVAFGSGAAERLRTLLPSPDEIAILGEGAVAIFRSAGEPATISNEGDRIIGVQIGDVRQAGSAATVDVESRTLELQTDPFGLHGISYLRDGEAIWAASDPRLLLGVRDWSGWNAAALHGYCCFSHVPAGTTLFDGIDSLVAGETLRFSGGVATVAHRTDWAENRPFVTDAASATEDLRMGLTRAVRDRIGMEQKVGVFLSGGLDSSLIAAILVNLGVEVELFTLDFGPPYDLEVPYARQVAAHLGRPLHLVSAKPGDVARAIDSTAAALQQPFGDGVVAPLFLLGRAAREHVDVVFNGEGGDQLFGGWSNKPMLAAEMFAPGDYDRVQAYLGSYHRFAGIEAGYFSSRALRQIDASSARRSIAPALLEGDYSTLLHRLRAANLRLKGAQNIAPRAAQICGANGLRVRSPFFDPDLARWSFSLAPELLLNGPSEKYVLKLAAEKLLPESVVWREKRGMGAPTTEWCLGPLRKELGIRLAGKRLRELGWFDERAVDRLRKGEDEPGEFRRRRLGEKLWLIIMLEAWRRSLGRKGRCGRGIA